MSRRPLAAVIAVAIAASFSFAAAMPAAQPAKTVPAKTWAKTFCNSVADWVETVTEGAEDLDLTAEDDPAAIRATLVAYIDDVTDETKSVIKRLKRAGNPKVPKGKKIAKTVRKGFVAIRDTMEQASELAAVMPIDSAEGADAVGVEIEDKIEEGVDEFEEAIAKARRLDKGAIDKAMAKTKACERLTG